MGLTARGNEPILTIVDSLSKMAHFVPRQTTVTAEAVVELLADRLIRYFTIGLPEKFISDRGPRFVADLWGKQCKQPQINRALSSAGHPQTDGQKAERVRRTLEQVLRTYIQSDEVAKYVKISSISGACRTQLHVGKLSGTPVRSISAQVIRTNSLISSPKQLVFAGHAVNKNRTTFLFDGVGLDWLQKSNPRVYWDHESLMLSDCDHCYKWEAVSSDAELHDGSATIRLCMVRHIRAYAAANEAYCNYVSIIQKLPEEALPQAIPPAVWSILQDFPDIQKERTT
ncbi:hypothetical protein Efla_006398 [Eimeria flavescens]